MEKKMTYDVNECPPLGKWIVLALQHVFAMFGATILVPILVNAAAGEVVLTIPVDFDGNQREATLRACKLAKLENIEFINEPSASILEYS